jgi:small-conductance mechanosensitive channel/CRP-like cAMP-binding protein
MPAMSAMPVHYWLYAAALVALVVWFGLRGMRSTDTAARRLTWVGGVLIASTALWLGLPAIAAWVGLPVVSGLLSDAARLFGVVWWLVFAFFAIVVLERFVWRALDRREIGVPKLLKDVVRALVLVVAMFGVVSAAFDQSFTGVLAASGVLAVVIGFAMQSTLADLFSGIALNLERPYKVGDWVRVDGVLAGQVVEINWRATRLRSAEGNTVVMPNSKLAAAQIVNYDLSVSRYRAVLAVPLDARIPPGLAKEALAAAALKSMRVCLEPPPAVSTQEIRDASIVYEVAYWVDTFDDDARVRDEVATSIWYALDAAGIALGQPRDTERPMAERVLDHVDLFRDLNQGLRARLAAAARIATFHARDEVVRLGDTDGSMFVVARGVFEVSLETDGRRVPVARLGTGDFFGEMSLLTGSPRSAHVTALCDTSALEFDKAALAPLLQAHPELATKLGDVVLDRKLANDATLRALPPLERRQATRNQAAALLANIRSFFSLD